MDILRMLEQLNDMAVNQPKQIVGKLVWGINLDDIQMQISKIRASLPQELKQASARVRESERLIEGAKQDANQTVEVAKREQDRMLDDARREAEKIIAEARKDAERLVDQGRIQQERMVTDSEIMRLAKAQGEEIRTTAYKEAAEVRRGAEQYAHDVLLKLEGVVGKIVTSIEKGKQELEPQPLPQAIVNAPKERLKVH